MSGWFITGTDTGVGKTAVACALLTALARAGRTAAGMKPIASGARTTPAGLRHDDAEALMAASNAACDYRDVNPYCFHPAVAPHLAAAEAGIEIRQPDILAAYNRLRAYAGHVVVEGAGGWRVPLGAAGFMSDVARTLGLPVLLVVGLRLGCLNHAVLTAEAIRRDAVPFAGWVANGIDPELVYSGRTLAALTDSLGMAPLAVFPYETAGPPLRWPGAPPF